MANPRPITDPDLARRVAEAASNKLKSSVGGAGDSLIVKELKKLSARMESKIPVFFEDKFFKQLQDSLSKLFTKALKDTAKKDDKKESSESESKSSNTFTGSKSLLQSVKETPKVEIANFKELKTILPEALKPALKEVNDNIKQLAKAISSIPKGGGGRSGGGLFDALTTGLDLFGGKKGRAGSLARRLGRTGVGRLFRRGNVALRRGVPNFLSKTLGKGTSLASRALGSAGRVGEGALGFASRVGGKALSLGSKLGGVAKFGGRLLGKAALPLAAAMSAYDAYKGFNADKNATTWQKIKNAGRDVTSGLTFGLVDSTKEKMEKGEYQGAQKAPSITPEPVKGAVEQKAPSVSERQEQIKKWGEKGYTRVGDIPPEEWKEFLEKNKIKSLSKAYSDNSLRKTTDLALKAYQAKKAGGEVTIEQGKVASETRPVEATPSVEQKAPSITPEPVKEAVEQKATPAPTPEVKPAGPTKKEALGKVMGGLAGAAIGQALIPIPVVGAAVGGMVGGWLGKKLTSKTPESTIETNKSTIAISSSEKQKQINAWGEKGYTHLGDIPPDEWKEFLEKYRTKSLPKAYANDALRKETDLALKKYQAKKAGGEVTIEQGKVNKPATEEQKAPSIAPEPVKEAIAQKAPSANPVIIRQTEKQNQYKEWREKGYTRVGEVPPEELKSFLEKNRTKSLPKAYADQALKKSIDLELNPTAVRKTVTSGPAVEQKAPSITPEPVKSSKIEVTPAAVSPSIKPAEETKSKEKSHKTLEEIASNTGDTNETLANLVAGFNNMAKALREFGINVANQPPTIINAGGSARQASAKPKSSQYANVGNSEITDFRSTTVEGARFQPA